MEIVNKIVGISCRRCGNTTLLVAPELAWIEFHDLPRSMRRPVQEIFPDLSIGDRELLISRTCNNCWQDMFGSDEDEEE